MQGRGDAGVDLGPLAVGSSSSILRHVLQSAGLVPILSSTSVSIPAGWHQEGLFCGCGVFLGHILLKKQSGVVVQLLVVPSVCWALPMDHMLWDVLAHRFCSVSQWPLAETKP